MKRRISFAAIAAAVLSVGFPGLASAATISTLFNTGAGLSSGSTDSNYTIVSGPSGLGAAETATSVAGFPLNVYVPGDDSVSTWIGPSYTPGNVFPGVVGVYDFQTHFDLTGLIASTASITGGWSADNNGIEIILNGTVIGGTATGTNQFLSGLSSFTIPVGSPFANGVNTLDFIVNNAAGNPGDPNPVALRVEITSATAAPVPEPASLTVFSAFGALGFFGYGWRSRKPVAV